MRGVAQRVTGRRVLQADGRDDVSGERRRTVFAVIRVHLQDAADALLAILRRVRNVAPRAQRARVDAEVRQLADVRIGRDLERERAERRVVRGLARGLLARGRGADDGGNVQRRRQIHHDRVEQLLDTFVLERGAAQDRRRLA